MRESATAHAFEARFEQIWAGANPLPAPGNQFANPAPTPAPKKDNSVAAGCLIKGNVSRNGERIYHVPGDSTYDRVRMDKGPDKRWFCTEEQAAASVAESLELVAPTKRRASDSAITTRLLVCAAISRPSPSVRQFLCDNSLSDRVFYSYDDIVNRYCDTWSVPRCSSITIGILIGAILSANRSFR